MAKTLVAAVHQPGPADNGVDGCHARTGNAGMCPGVQLAAWLNALGDDTDLYLKGNPAVAGARPVTCGEVRTNWLRGGNHIKALEPERVRLVSEINRLSVELRRAKKSLRTLEKNGGVR